MPPPTLYILYNANATLLGKLDYTRRKLTASNCDDPACAACDITHGGLRLNESEAWKRAKSRIVFQGAEEGVIRQLHRDEIHEEEVRAFIKTKELKYPMVLLRPPTDTTRLEQLMSRDELTEFKGDPGDFVKNLGEKGEPFGLSVTDEGEGKGEGHVERRKSWLAKW